MPVSAAPDLHGYLDAAKTKYGITSGDIGTCELCHINPLGGGTRNGYGEAFNGIATHAADPAQAFADIELLDSDGDTFNNITEIQALTFPGDANSKPAETAIIIEKQTMPNGDPQSFTFTGDVSGSLSDGQTAKKIVTPGTYSVDRDCACGLDALEHRL